MKKKVAILLLIVMVAAVMAVVLTACSASSYEKKLEDAGYKVTVYENEDAKEQADVGDYEIKWTITAGKLDFSGVGLGYIVSFKKAADAKEVYEELVELGLFKADEGIVRQLNVLIMGSEDFVKAAK
jgi:major membrane immunogen (membrane-anchored lipoprotein)